MITTKPEIEGSFRPGTVPSRRPASQEVASRAAGGNGSASVVGADLVIIGNLECRGELQIEGEVQGDIHAQRVVIGEHAHVIGA
jgi:cytoskeletal protein CcmA (bactofilin family)